MKKTVMYMLPEAVSYMMSFVIETKNNNVIIIDGGRKEDMKTLKKYVANKHISAWILTHAHFDHISGFISEIKENGGKDFDIEKIYYNFPPYDIINNHNVLDYELYAKDLNNTLPAFDEILPAIESKTVVVNQGDKITIDEISIDFIFTYHENLTNNVINDSSLVFKVKTGKKEVLFLGDIGPEAGDVLYRESRHLLKADIVQMAHHGHMCCGLEVYAAITPEACLWCAEEWLYNEPELHKWWDIDFELLRKSNRMRMYGTAITRKWMDALGVKKHYVTKDGAHKIKLS